MKNILFIGSIDFPFNTANSNFIRRLFTPIVAKGNHVELFLVRGATDSYNQSNQRSRVNEYAGIKYRYCSFRNKPNLLLAKFLEIFIGVISSSSLLICRILRRQVDVVFIYTGYPYINLPVVLISRLFRKKIVKISVDWYVKEQVVSKPYFIFKWWLFLFEIKVLDKLLSGVIVLNRKLKEHYEKIGLSNILLVPSVIDMDEFKIDEAVKQDYITIGYCGAAPLLNGVDDLLVAFSSIVETFPNCKLLIIGDKVGRGSDLESLKDLSKRLGISSKVEFTGRIPSSEVPRKLSICNILILPRKKSVFADYGFPTKLGEYFAMKKPVVLTRVGDFENYFSNMEQVVFCEPENPSSIADALRYLIVNKEEAKRIALNGYTWALHNLNGDYVSAKFLSFIKTL